MLRNAFDSVRRKLETGDLVLFLYAAAFLRQYLWVVPDNRLAWALVALAAALVFYLHWRTKEVDAERTPAAFGIQQLLPQEERGFNRRARRLTAARDALTRKVGTRYPSTPALSRTILWRTGYDERGGTMTIMTRRHLLGGAAATLLAGPGGRGTARVQAAPVITVYKEPT